MGHWSSYVSCKMGGYMQDDVNWPHVGFANCPHCHERVYRLAHSSMSDDYCLYCDQCATSVDVGCYDPVLVISWILEENARESCVTGAVVHVASALL